MGHIVETDDESLAEWSYTLDNAHNTFNLETADICCDIADQN